MREIAIELADCSETEIAKKRAERREEKKKLRRIHLAAVSRIIISFHFPLLVISLAQAKKNFLISDIVSR
jgi:hypothetical protein